MSGRVGEWVRVRVSVRVGVSVRVAVQGEDVAFSGETVSYG